MSSSRNSRKFSCFSFVSPRSGPEGKQALLQGKACKARTQTTLLLCYSRFCLMWLLLLPGSALTMKTVHDVMMWYRKAQNGLLFIMTFSSLTHILSRITLRWHFFFQITKEKSVLNGKTCLFYCTADTEE